jgi:hypothetical protein
MLTTPPAGAFQMYGAREVLDARAVHIEQQVVALEQAVATNPGLAFDLAKTLLESTCKTVLAECKAGYDGAWELPRLLKETLAQLRLVPAALVGDRDVADSLRKTAGGLQTAIQGICELRNTHGFASHGKDGAFQQLESVQAMLAARAADTIVSFLFRVHRGYNGDGATGTLAYEDHPGFNERVDDMHPLVRIFSEEFAPSRVLFELAPEPYRLYLAEYHPDPEPEEAEEEGAAMRVVAS